MLQLSLAETQTVIFLWLTAVDGQVIIYPTRTRRFFWRKPYPGRWVMVATFLVVGATGLMTIQGWLMAPLRPSLVGAMLLMAVAFLLVADQLKHALTRVAARWPIRQSVPNP